MSGLFFFLLHYNLSVPLRLQYRRFVFSLPSMCGSSGASVVSQRITRRQSKRRRVKEQERLREDEDILNGKLNNSKHFIEAQTSYFPLLHLRLCTLLLHLSNYRVCYKFPLSSWVPLHLAFTPTVLVNLPVSLKHVLRSRQRPKDEQVVQSTPSVQFNKSTVVQDLESLATV